MVVSEEEEEAIIFDEHPNARYAVACDPIDGSSNLDAGVSVGTIFGIFKLPDRCVGPGNKVTKNDLLMPGTELLAAGFTMYGASAQLVITMKGGNVNGFTLDAALGEFILTHPDMKIPKKRAIYSVNEGNSLYWEDNTKKYFESLKYPVEESGKPYSGRYIGMSTSSTSVTTLSKKICLSSEEKLADTLVFHYRQHGSRCLPHPPLWRHIRLPCRQEVSQGEIEDLI